MSYDGLEYKYGHGPGDDIFRRVLDTYHGRLLQVILGETLCIVLVAVFITVFDTIPLFAFLGPSIALFGVGATLVWYCINAKLSKHLYHILSEIREAYPLESGNRYVLTFKLRNMHLRRMEEYIGTYMSSRPAYRMLVRSYVLPAGMLIFWGFVLSYFLFYEAHDMGFAVSFGAFFVTAVLVTASLNYFIPGFEMQPMWITNY